MMQASSKVRPLGRGSARAGITISPIVASEIGDHYLLQCLPIKLYFFGVHMIDFVASLHGTTFENPAIMTSFVASSKADACGGDFARDQFNFPISKFSKKIAMFRSILFHRWPQSHSTSL